MQICPVRSNDNNLLGLAFVVSTAKKGHNPPSNYKYSKPAQLSKLGVQQHGRSMKNFVPLYSAGSLLLSILDQSQMCHDWWKMDSANFCSMFHFWQK